MNSDLLHQIEQGRNAFLQTQYEEAYTLLNGILGEIEKEENIELLDEVQTAELYAIRGMSLAQSNGEEVYEDSDLFNAVMDDYEQAVDLVPYNPDYLHLRGRSYMLARFTEYLEEARRDLSEALRYDRQHRDSLKSMGELFMRMEDYDKAIYYFSELLKEGEEKDTLALRGYAFLQKQAPKFKEAALDLGKSLEIDPMQADLYIWRAEIFSAIDRYEDALVEYNKLLGHFPDQAEYYIERANLNSEIQPEKALEDYSKAIELADHPSAYNNRAFLYRQQGRFEEAISDAERAIQLDPSQTIAYATLAEIYADLGDKEYFYHFLELALDNYYDDYLDSMSEPSFQPFVNEPEFQRLIEKQKAKIEAEDNPKS